MRLSAILLILAACLSGQVATYGTVGAVQSPYWENAALSYGAGASYTLHRWTIGAEAFRAETARERNPILNRDQRAEAALALGAYRAWRGLHTECGYAAQRHTWRAYGPLIEGATRVTGHGPTAGAYYQIGSRVFARAGYRRLFIAGDHDTNQTYVSVGVTFGK